MMCTVLTAALPYPHAVIPIEPDDDRSRCGALVTDAKGACSQFGRPQVGSELVHALGVCRLELKLMGRRRHRNGALAPLPAPRDVSSRRPPNEQASAVRDCALPVEAPVVDAC